MYLSNLKLWNFRKFGTEGKIDLEKSHLSVSFHDGLNVLIGENDSGKTAIIDAIKLVLKTHSYEWIRLEEHDFHVPSNRMRIECRFEGFSDDEAKNFTEWLGMIGENADAKPYLRVILDVSKNEDRILPFEIRAGVDDVGYALTAEAKEYLKTTYLKPLRDAKTELVPRKNSRLSQILIGHPSFQDKDDHELLQLSEDVALKIQEYFHDSSKDGEQVRKALEIYLTNFFGQKKTAKFSLSEQNLKSVLETLKLTLEDEKLGLGSHNLLFMAAELLNLERGNWNGLRLGLIEELEAHLHPQAQLRVIDYLQSKFSPQIIISTHSPNLGSKIELKNLLICHGESVFPMGDEFTKLEESDYKFLERFLDVTKANLFFSRGVILVEGWAEELLLPEIAKKIDIDLTERGISVVNVGNTAFLRYCKIFQREDENELDLPVSVITDIDILPDEYKSVDGEKKTESDFVLPEEEKKIKAKYGGQGVKAFVSPHWTLEYCLALNSDLREHLFEAIKAAGEEQKNDGRSGKQVPDTYEDFLRGKDDKTFAFDLYYSYIKAGKRISKSIIAQQMAERIKNDRAITKEQIESDPNISYLIEAIKHASEQNTN